MSLYLFILIKCNQDVILYVTRTHTLDLIPPSSPAPTPTALPNLSLGFADDISSVDILDIRDSYYVDIRDVYSKEWRRHRTLSAENRSVPGHKRDYRQVARYRMRSIGDAAELFVLLYKFITQSWER